MNAPAQGNGNSVLVQGRIIWGLGKSMFAGQQKTDMQTKQVILDNSGQPTVEYGFGLAILKVDPRTNQFTEDYTKFYQAAMGEAMTMYPGGQIPPSFAMKYKDGDTAIVEETGKPYSEREGYVGHIVVTCTTQIPIKWFRWEGGNNILVNDGIKVGDYVNVQLNMKAHPAVGRGKAGLYMNPSAVRLIAQGKEIISTSAPSGDQMFGQAQPSYAGIVVAPVAPTMPGQAQNFGAPAMTPAMPGNYGQAPQAPQMPPQQPAYAPAAQPAYDPHYGVLPQHQQPQAPQAPQMPPQQPQMQPNPQQGWGAQPPVNPAYGQQAPNMPAYPGMPPR